MTFNDIENIIFEMKNTIDALKKEYGEKILSITKQIDDIQNNADHHSKKFIEDSTAKLKKELDDVTNTLKKKTDSISAHITEFNKKQTSKIQDTLGNSLKAKIGIDVTLPQL